MAGGMGEFGEFFGTRAEMRAMFFESIDVFYNRKSLYSTLGYRPAC